MDTKALLMKLSSTSGVSGSENTVFSVVSDAVAELGVSRDMMYEKAGNLIINFGTRSNDRPHVLIDAHADEIGFIVTYIDDDGFIVPGNVGGMDFRILPAQRVTVHGKTDIAGVVCTLPPHLSDGADPSSGMENVRIDTGFSADELRKKVSPGDMISFRSEAHALYGDRVMGKSLDNRAGICAVLKMVSVLSSKEAPSCSYSLVFSSSEEIGERGAATACFDIDPDIAVAVDVSFAYSKGEKPEDCGTMSKGPMIGISPSLSREISDLMIAAATDSGIPYQTEIMPGLSGTNADRFSVCRSGVKSGTCSIPLKYMHTPAEVTDVKDIELTAELLAEFLRRVK